LEGLHELSRVVTARIVDLHEVVDVQIREHQGRS
jgi:hypothetical protein